MVQMERYDVCVIGGGPAGYAAAMRTVDFDRSVLLVERERVGGAGIYNGALSSKAFWEISREIAAIRDKLEHYQVQAPAIAFAKVAAEVNDAVRERADLLLRHMQLVQQRQPGRFRYVQGSGRLLDPQHVQVSGPEGTETLEVEHIVLATGSRPRTLPSIPIDERTIMTSDGVSSLRDFPRSIVILGAGVIGCEFATIFSNFGRTEVHLIDKEPRILPFEDADLASVIQGNLERAGVLIHRQSRLVSMGIADGQVEYTLEFADKRQQRFTAEKALISVGRVPNVEGLGLEALGIRCGPGGHILDTSTRSSVPNVYAVGDLTADIALVNVGELEGRHAIERIFGQPQRDMAYDNISTIMFLSPETAGVGMNELQAQKKGLSYRVASFGFECIPRAVAMRKTQG
ncbi:MAG TPA: NAD(P)/FAD-dependent oxidoreductase, partial [bacterium]|nr:NAD(P)/FAD-dependent oxidoreductase [bacterium]